MPESSKSTSSKSSSSGSANNHGSSTSQLSTSQSSSSLSDKQDLAAGFDTTFRNKNTYIKKRMTMLENVIAPLEGDGVFVSDDDVDLMKRHCTTVDDVWESVSDLILSASCLKPDDIDTYMDTLNGHIPRIMDLRARIKSLTSLPVSMMASASSVATNNPQQKRTKVDNTFKPQALDDDATPSLFHKWQNEFSVYIRENAMDKAPLDAQRMLLNNCLTPKMESTLSKVCLVEDSTPINDILQILETYFNNSNNLMTRRHEFFACNQKGGESLNDFIIRFRNLGDYAELDKLPYKDIMACKLVTGVADDDLRQQLLKLPKTDFDSIHKHAMAWISSKTNSGKLKELRTNTNINSDLEVNKLSTYKQHKKKNFKPNTHQSQSQASQNNNSKPTHQNRRPCNNCGQTHPPRSCPAYNKSCSFCGILGHFERRCRKKNSSHLQRVAEIDAAEEDSTEADFDPEQEINGLNFDLAHLHADIDNNGNPAQDTQVLQFDISRLNFDANPTPRIQATFYNNQHILGTENILPDTGASVSVLPANFIQKWNLTPEPLSHPCEFKSVDGFKLSCMGTISLYVTIANRRILVSFLVLPQVRSIIISWMALKSFNIVPTSFPIPMDDNSETAVASVQGNSYQALTTYCIQRYPEVFGRATKLKKMTGDPMTIHIKQNIDYSNIRQFFKPRSIPIPLQQAAKQQLDIMIRQEIIRPVAQPTQFLSPLLVVPKRNGDVRLVVDYTQLNKHIQRPTHPFPSVAEVKALIPPTAKYFATLDAVQGYWQVPLDQKSQILTTFITPWGRFCFNRAPMGLSASGDEYCRRGDLALAGIPNIIKVVDDILIYASSQQELHNLINRVLTAARNHGMTLSPEKFNIGTSISFVGLTISNQGITPDPKHLAAIAQFPIPVNKTDLRSFMGIVNQFSSFSPDIAKYARSLRPLLCKQSSWSWDDSHQSAFNMLRNILVSPPVLQYFDPKRETKLLTDASRLNGLGYVLLQKLPLDNKWGIISCGSRFITSTESNYAVCELEALAITWAIQKCRVFLLGSSKFQCYYRP